MQLPLRDKHRGICCGIVFQTVWFVCVFAPLFWVLASFFAFLVFYWTFVSRRAGDYIFAAALAAFGYFWDSLWIYFGVMQMPSAWPPLWLGILWFVFSLSLPYAFFFLLNRPILAAVLGAFGGAGSYLGAINFRADIDLGVSFGVGFVCLALFWGVFFPLAMRVWQATFKQPIAAAN